MRLTKQHFRPNFNSRFDSDHVRVQTHVGLGKPPDRATIDERARVSQPVRDGEQKGDPKQSVTAAAVQTLAPDKGERQA